MCTKLLILEGEGNIATNLVTPGQLFIAAIFCLNLTLKPFCIGRPGLMNSSKMRVAESQRIVVTSPPERKVAGSTPAAGTLPNYYSVNGQGGKSSREVNHSRGIPSVPV